MNPDEYLEVIPGADVDAIYERLNEIDARMTETLAQIDARVAECNAAINSILARTQTAIDKAMPIIEDLKPTLTQLADSPMIRMLTGGKGKK